MSKGSEFFKAQPPPDMKIGDDLGVTIGCWAGTKGEYELPPLDDAYVVGITTSPAAATVWKNNAEVYRGDVTSGGLQIIAPGESKRALIHTDYAVVRAVVPLDAIAVRSGLGGGVRLVCPNLAPDHLLESISRTITEAASQRASRLYLDSATELLVQHLVWKHSSAAPPPPAPARSGLAPYQIRRALDFINDHLGDPISLAELARVVDLSPQHFARAFKATTGLPPHRWQLQRRIDRAKALMTETDGSLTDIAIALGFADQAHFTTVFRKSVGATPHAWRRANMA